MRARSYYDFKNPGSQGAPGSFFGLETGFKGTGEAAYPGGVFDPLGLSKDAKTFETAKWQEIRNGRLAMARAAAHRGLLPGCTPRPSPATCAARPHRHHRHRHPAHCSRCPPAARVSCLRGALCSPRAQVAFAGFAGQSISTGATPIDNLLAHVASPWTTTVATNSVALPRVLGF